LERIHCSTNLSIIVDDTVEMSATSIRAFFASAVVLALSLNCFAAERVRVVSPPEQGEVPDAEIDRDGTIHIAYVVGENAYYASSRDNGETFSAPIRINSEAETVHPPHMYRGPDLALGSMGRVHVIWYANAYQRKLPQDQWGVFYSRLDPEKRTFAPSRNLNHTPSDNYSLAADAKGNVAVVWTADQMFVTSSHDNGETFPSTEAVAVAQACECCATRALFSPDGSLLIDYREKGNNMRDMHLLSRSPTEKDFRKQKVSSTPWQINACPMTGTFVSTAKNGLLTAWETKGQVFYARTTPAKGGQPKEIKVAPQGKWPIALEAPDGSVLISWKSGSTVWWRLFDSKDTPTGAAQSKPGSNANRHAGVVTRDGNFLLVD
jgi:hypothetical protein